jgi:hypothetical protein
MKLVLYAWLCLLTTEAAFPQQVRTADLTHPTSTQARKQQEQTPLPADCRKPQGGMAYGAVMPDDKQPRPISLEIVKLNRESLEVGSEVRAEVRLRNIGSKAITIPWSTDSIIIDRGPNPDQLQWEQANFEFTLRDKQNRRIPTSGTEVSLYGTKSSEGSLVTVNPSEWVTAIVSFRLEDVYHIMKPVEFPTGDANLFVEWQQESRYWTRLKCGWSSAWLD